ncbi:hypothetical protein MHYP_G00337750 [Metynnis hypsauchen]
MHLQAGMGIMSMNHTLSKSGAGIRAVVTATGSGPSCRKRQRKHAVSEGTRHTVETVQHYVSHATHRHTGMRKHSSLSPYMLQCARSANPNPPLYTPPPPIKFPMNQYRLQTPKRDSCSLVNARLRFSRKKLQQLSCTHHKPRKYTFRTKHVCS